jgi:hypothetical protein
LSKILNEDLKNAHNQKFRLLSANPKEKVWCRERESGKVGKGKEERGKSYGKKI